MFNSNGVRVVYEAIGGGSYPNKTFPTREEAEEYAFSTKQADLLYQACYYDENDSINLSANEALVMVENLMKMGYIITKIKEEN